MATKARRHVHRYQRRLVAGIWVWGCALPQCSHYMPKHMESMVEGKASVCNTCDNTIMMTGEYLEMPVPKCTKCRAKEEADLARLFEQAQSEVNEIKITESTAANSEKRYCKRCRVIEIGIENQLGICPNCFMLD
jgi:hypothetical protein